MFTRCEKQVWTFTKALLEIRSLSADLFSVTTSPEAQNNNEFSEAGLLAQIHYFFLAKLAKKGGFLFSVFHQCRGWPSTGTLRYASTSALAFSSGFRLWPFSDESPPPMLSFKMVNSFGFYAGGAVTIAAVPVDSGLESNSAALPDISPPWLLFLGHCPFTLLHELHLESGIQKSGTFCTSLYTLKSSSW